LDDDLSIKVEDIRIALEGELLDGGYCVNAIAAVKLRQLGSKQSVLHNGEYAIAEIFVERHAAL
jgi:hypothetical protein